MDISTILTTDSNYVEIHFCPDRVALDTNNVIKVGWDQPAKLNNRLTNATKQEIKEYFHRDLVYLYDLQNDGQRVYRKLPQKEYANGNLYAIAYIEEVLPSHRFPCTDEIAHEHVINRTSYRINNRMYFVHDVDESSKHTYYIRYNHADNVDLKKMQLDLDKFIAMTRLARTC